MVAMKKKSPYGLSGMVRRFLNFFRLHLYFKVSHKGLGVCTLRKPPSYISQYYEYCVTGILNSLDSKNRGKLSIFLLGQDFSFDKRVRSVRINTEHTLVRENGRGSAGSPRGNIPVIGGNGEEKYLVRVSGGARGWSNTDQIIDYSVPNMINVHRSELAEVYSGKSHYIAPLLSPTMFNPSIEGRDLSKVFTFMSLTEGGDRRSEVIDGLKELGVKVANIQGLVGDPSETMSRIGVLLNLHQTEHHHTLEELRILPALLQGVVVVSEPSPLTEQIPYSKFVKFASISEMPGVLSGLLANYEKHWNDTFAAGEFNKVMSDLGHSNKKAFAQLVQNLAF